VPTKTTTDPTAEQLIRGIRDAGRPLVGICFGHPRLSPNALAEKSKNSAGAGLSAGPNNTIERRNAALNACIKDQSHELPKARRLSAASDFCANAALAYDDQIWTIQPTPSFTQDFIDGPDPHAARRVPDHQP